MDRGPHRLRGQAAPRLARPGRAAPGGGGVGASALAVRWSLADAPEGVEEALRDYVGETSHARFEQREGLRFKTWRMRSGEWFEGCYVFVDEAARIAFQESFTQPGADAPG